MSQPPFPLSPEDAREARLRALRVAQEAAAVVPAYARFLRHAGYDARRLRGVADFQALPIMDKASYLERYPLAERTRHGELTQAHLVTRSSGTAGPATYWPRLPEQDRQHVAGSRALYQEHFRILERWTLMVVAAAMGPWAFATGASLVAQRLFSEPDIRGTVVTPGQDQEATLQFVEQLGRHYDQTILMSYPGLLPALLEAGVARGIDWQALDTSALVAGEPMSEPQRERILGYLGKDPERLDGLVNVFGASEAPGIVGYETRVCLLLRRLCLRTPALGVALFGSGVLPSVNQYHPLRRYLEIADGELLLTLRGAVPLIRYNTHDRGGLLPFDDVVAVCRAHGHDLPDELRARGVSPSEVQPLPFLYVFGRSDAVILHGGNLYLDEVAHALDQSPLQAATSGSFELSTSSAADGSATVRLVVELGRGMNGAADLRERSERQVLEALLRVSPRFQAAYNASRGRARLDLKLVPFGHLQGRGPKQQRVVLANDPTADAED